MRKAPSVSGTGELRESPPEGSARPSPAIRITHAARSASAGGQTGPRTSRAAPAGRRRDLPDCRRPRQRVTGAREGDARAPLCLPRATSRSGAAPVSPRRDPTSAALPFSRRPLSPGDADRRLPPRLSEPSLTVPPAPPGCHRQTAAGAAAVQGEREAKGRRGTTAARPAEPAGRRERRGAPRRALPRRTGEGTGRLGRRIAPRWPPLARTHTHTHTQTRCPAPPPPRPPRRRAPYRAGGGGALLRAGALGAAGGRGPGRERALRGSGRRRRGHGAGRGRARDRNKPRGAGRAGEGARLT